MTVPCFSLSTETKISWPLRYQTKIAGRHPMQTSEFHPDMPGQLIKTLDGEPAFIPDPLPPRQLSWTSDLISMLSSADRALGRLAGIGAGDLSGVNPHLLIRPFLRREAVLSSRIEGTQATLSDLF